MTVLMIAAVYKIGSILSTSNNLDPLEKGEVEGYIQIKETSSFESFNEMMDLVKTVIEVNFNKNNWKTSSWSCPDYMKIYMCKHIIGMSARYKKAEIPEEAKTNRLGKKRKGGRSS